MERRDMTTILRLTLRSGLLFTAIIAIIVAPAPSAAREVEHRVPIMSEPAGPGIGVTAFSVSGQVTADTLYFGGTVWDAAQGRWEAAEPSAPGWANGKMWTWSPAGFGGTPHSGLNMDGWGVDDNTDDAGNGFRVMDSGQIGVCVVTGSKSLFCGKTGGEATAACFRDASGTGYGNSWRQQVATPAFDYVAGDQITLSYDYSVDTELGYDFAYVILEHYDSGSGEWVGDTVGAGWSGVASGSDVADVDAFLSALGSVQFRVKFMFASDGGYSDQDGLNVTSCGAAAFDNVSLSGNVTFSEDFEDETSGALPPGWQRLSDGCGTLARARHISELPVSLTEDPCVTASPGMCGIADSVIVMVDLNVPGNPHPFCQEEYLVSPVVDLSSHPGLGGKLVRLERFAKLPVMDLVFMVWRVKYAPACELGGWGPWVSDNYVYYTPEGASCAPWVIDVSSYVPPSALEMLVEVGVINYCDEDPWWLGCTSVSNATPYYDNVSVAVFRGNQAPYVSMREYDYWQDQFAENGSLNPTSTADSRTANYLSNLVPPIFGDTLVCRGSDDNVEMYFVFRMARVGPEQAMTHSFFTSWFPGAAAGGWVEIRMDTAEVTDATGLATAPYPGVWMCAFHEDDPVRTGNALSEGTEILPNNLFVPGTRVEYFLKTRYAGSSDFFLLPDTAGASQAEFEILPMIASVGGSSYSSPCVLVVDHFAGRGNSGETNAHRIARHLRAKGIEFDMFNKLGPASDLRNGIGRWAANPGQLGGPGTPKYNWGPGATNQQMSFYRYCIVNTGNVYAYSVYQQDTDLLKWWLDYSWDECGGEKLLWFSGDKVYRELSRRTPWGPSFLNTILCATYSSALYQTKTGDYTFCLPMDGVAGGSIGGQTPESYVIATQDCPRVGSGGQNVIGVSAAAGCNAVREIEYHAGHDQTQELAALSRVEDYGSGNIDRILTEAYDFCLVRTGDLLGPPDCDSDAYLSERIDSVLAWAKYDSSRFCGYKPHGDFYPFAAEMEWHNLAADSNKVLVCPGVAEWPGVDTCKSAWVDVYVTYPPCLHPVPGAPLTLTVTSSTCESLLCAPVTGYTDANGYARMYIRGSVDASAGPGCCTVSTTLTCYDWPILPVSTNTFEWLSPDLNGDGLVGALDVGILVSDFGTSACRSDFNCDGTVDQVDLDILEQHYRHSCTGQVIDVEEVPPSPPAATSLSQNYPNPFNPSTEIKFAVAEPGRVVLRIYDVVGRPVRTLVDGRKEPGYYTVVWDGRDDTGQAAVSGVYFYGIQAPGCEELRKMVLLR